MKSTSTTKRLSPRPYISLVMELGVTVDKGKANHILERETRTNPPQQAWRTTSAAAASKGEQTEAGASGDASGTTPDKKRNIRYAIAVYGCTKAAYKAIRSSAEETALRKILQLDDAFSGCTLGREELAMLELVKNQLPVLSTKKLFQDITGAPYSSDLGVSKKGKGGCRNEREHEGGNRNEGNALRSYAQLPISSHQSFAVPVAQYPTQPPFPECLCLLFLLISLGFVDSVTDRPPCAVCARDRHYNI